MRVLIAATALVLLPATLVAQNTQVLTQHNDNARTGANLTETVLNVAAVSSGSFGLLYSLPVDGEVYAQPLYMQGLEGIRQPLPPGAKIGPGPYGPHNVLYVATMHNNVYAFDADDPQGTVLWHSQLQHSNQLEPSVPANFMPLSAAAASLTLDEVLSALTAELDANPGEGCKLPAIQNQPSVNIANEIGITSTPVIDPVSQTLFVVDKTYDQSIRPMINRKVSPPITIACTRSISARVLIARKVRWR
jgi:PQQ enzyme repeat